MILSQHNAILVLTGTLLFGIGHAALAQVERLPFDSPLVVDDIEFVCTGIGREARSDPRWTAYPLRVEVAGADGQFLGAIEMTFERDGMQIANVICSGPWVLAQLGAGSYKVTTTFEGLSASGEASVPETGQERLIIRFPEAGGSVSAERSLPQ